jgi:hypothetical protein
VSDSPVSRDPAITAPATARMVAGAPSCSEPLAAALVSACTGPFLTAEDPTATIRAMLESSAQAWNAGDLDRFIDD